MTLNRFFLLTLLTIAAGCATTPATTPATPKTAAPSADDKVLLDIRPAASAKTDAPIAAEWQRANRGTIDAATTEVQLAQCVRDRVAAARLVAEVKPDYASDALKLTQLAAVTQYVMLPTHDAARRIWTAALLEGARASSDVLVKTILLDQLRWCGYGAQAAAVRAVGEETSDRHLKEMCALVAHELTLAER